MTTPQTVPAVYAAIAAVQGELATSGIGKNQVNQHGKYRFRGIDDVYNALAPALTKSGLVILPRYTEREVTERATKGGGHMFCVTLRVEFDFIATADGSRHTVTAYGEAMDTADKATPKAMSAAYKYACFQAFCIPTAATPDADAETLEVGAHVEPPAIINTAQAADLKRQLEETQSDVVAFCKNFRVGSVDELPASVLPAAQRALDSKRRRMAKDAAETAA